MLERWWRAGTVIVMQRSAGGALVDMAAQIRDS